MQITFYVSQLQLFICMKNCVSLFNQKFIFQAEAVLLFTLLLIHPNQFAFPPSSLC